MNKTEITNYVNLGKNKSVCISVCLLDNYPGYVRDITIMQNNIVRIEFNIYGTEDGGITIKIYYNDLDKVIYALEEYIGEKIITWENINKSGWYPELNEEVNYTQSSLKLKDDFVNNRLLLPQNAIKYEILGGYWKELYGRKIEIVK